MSTSKKDRFEIFKRDGFRCVYCGKQPPEVTLELDHILAKARGGKDEYDNYCTSCFDCNRGKSDRLLSALPPNAMDRLAAIQERLEDLHALKVQSKLSKKLQKKENEVRQELVNHWCGAFGITSMQKQTVSMMVARLRWIDIETMKGLIDSCAQKMLGGSPVAASKYMSGILRCHLASIGIDYNAEVRK